MKPSINNNGPSFDNKYEKQLLNVLESSSNQGRGQKATNEISELILSLISKLEEEQDNQRKSTKFISPIDSEYLHGCWKLLYTSSPGTNSPIQRTFTASEKVTVFQVINIDSPSSSSLKTFLPNNLPDVSNIVCIGDKVRLRVTALASTIKRPLVEPRKGNGKIFGLNIFGVSSSMPPKGISSNLLFSCYY